MSALAVAFALALAGAGASGCNKPSSDNIQLWKTTEKGPERLHEALADHGTPPRLRAEAAVALVDIGRAEEVDTIFQTLPADDRAEIAKSLEPLWEVGMKDPSPEKALSSRDALYSLRQFVTPDDQKRIDAALLPALEADLKAGHLRQGRHSIDKMLTAIGSDAGGMLARVLAEPDASYVQAAELLGKVGDADAREKGGAALVARAKTDKGHHASGKPGAKEPEGSIYKALGSVGGPTAVKYLEEKVTGPNKDDAALAVRALEERRDPSVLPFALKIASDPKGDKIVRDEMFGVIETIGGLEAQRGLLGIISSDREEIVRYRAFESALTAGKADAIQPALEAFPASVAYKKVDVDDLLVKLIEKLGAPARPALVKTLGSTSPLARMTALMALEQLGRAPDAPGVEKLATDSTTVKGFPAGETIGKQAVAVAELLKEKTLMSANGRKSPRQFLCSDALWSTVQRMAEDQEKGLDELVSDAIVAYAQLAGYQTGISDDDDDGPATPPPVRSSVSGFAAAAANASRPLAPPPPPMPPAGGRFGRPIPGPGGLGVASPPLGAGADGTPGGSAAPPLYLVFDNQKYRIDKDQFIIGRGSKSSDLPIKDGNISRKHAAVIRRNGTYFIKDLGSTNGIDFKGMRIDNKRIDEGDLFHLCDYELRFTYKR